MKGDAVITRAGPVAVPLDYTVPVGTQIIPRVVTATLNGTNAGGPFLAVLEVIAPSGVVTARCLKQVQIAAGASAAVSWFPFVGGDDAATVDVDTSSGILTLTSTAGTIGVSAPVGPTTNVDLPASGVAAGTYGDATHTAQVTVNARGIVTVANQIGISGIAGTGLVKLFDTTLGAAAASIDTGANAIPTGHGDLLVVILAKTSQAVASSSARITLNGDTAAHYDIGSMRNLNGVQGSGRSLAASNWDIDVSGANAGQYPSIVNLLIPSYDQTTFQKFAQILVELLDQGGGAWELWQLSAGWRSTAAINQITLTADVGNLQAGSRMAIYGTQ